jgi:hypothetical protein
MSMARVITRAITWVTYEMAKLTALQNQIINLISSQPGIGSSALAHGMGRDRRNINKAALRLVELGYCTVRRTNEGDFFSARKASVSRPAGAAKPHEEASRERDDEVKGVGSAPRRGVEIETHVAADLHHARPTMQVDRDEPIEATFKVISQPSNFNPAQPQQSARGTAMVVHQANTDRRPSGEPPTRANSARRGERNSGDGRGRYAMQDAVETLARAEDARTSRALAVIEAEDAAQVPRPTLVDAARLGLRALALVPAWTASPAEQERPAPPARKPAAKPHGRFWEDADDYDEDDAVTPLVAPPPTVALPKAAPRLPLSAARAPSGAAASSNSGSPKAEPFWKQKKQPPPPVRRQQYWR